MSTTDQFIYESILDNKRFLKSQKNLERSMQRFETRVQKIKADAARKEIKHEQTVQAATKRSESVKRGEVSKTAAKQQRELQKQQRKQAAFEKWKLTQYRSTAFQRLNLEQQMNVKRILSSKNSEEEIRDAYQRTTSIYKREIQQRRAYEKRQRSVGSGRGAAAVAGRGGAMGGMAGGLMALASNPIALGVGASVAAGGMLINAGADNVTETRRAADDAGVDFQTFDRRAFVDSNVSGMSTEKIGQIYQDVNDKLGDFNANVEVGKDGDFKSGGELTDVANLLKRETGASNDDVRKMLQGSSIEVADRVNEALAGSDVQTRTFALESLSSDLFKLQQARGNTDRVQSAQQQFDSMNLGFSDEDLSKINEVSTVMDGFFSVLSRAPTEAFKSFASNLSPETLEMLGKIGELIVNVAGIIGDGLATALNLLSPILNPLIDLINWLVKGLKVVTGAFADLVSGFHPVTAAIEILDKIFKKVFGITLSESFKGWIHDFKMGLDLVFGFLGRSISGFFKDIVNKLPGWLKTDNMAKWAEGGDDMGKSSDDTPKAKEQAQEQADKDKETAVKAGVTKEGDNVTNSAITNSAINNAAYNTYNKRAESYSYNTAYNNTYNKREQADQRVYNNTYNKREHNNNVNNNTVNNTLPDGSSSYNQRAQAAKAQQALPTPETTQNANSYAARAQAMQRVQVQNQANVTLNLDGEQLANVIVDSEEFNEGTQRAMRNAALPNY